MPDSSVIIRPATIADASGIGVVHVTAWQWAYRGLLPDELLDELDPVARGERWTKSLTEDPDAPPLVAELSGEIIGFCAYGPTRLNDAAPNTGEVMAIYIAEHQLGKGTGRALWSAAISNLKEQGHTQVSLWALDTNTLGRNFYERMGLRPDGQAEAGEVQGVPVNHIRYVGPIA